MAYRKFIPPIGHSTAVLNARKGTNNEIILDPTTKELVIYDGVTKGGVRVARKDLVAELVAQVAALTDAVNTLASDMATYYEGKAPAYMSLPEE